MEKDRRNMKSEDTFHLHNVDNIEFDVNLSKGVLFANYGWSKLEITFHNSLSIDEQITYVIPSEFSKEHQNDYVEIRDGMIRAVGKFNNPVCVKIEAKTSHFSKFFIVKVMRFDGANAQGVSLELEESVIRLLEDYKKQKIIEEPILFIGDSFFDTRYFWTRFDETLAGNNAFAVGISSTTLTDWHLLVERLVFPLKPNKIVLHCGTNDIFDDYHVSEEVFRDYKILINKIFKELPNVMIYSLGIEPRKKKSVIEVNAVNEMVKELSQKNSQLIYIDSPSLCYQEDNTINDAFYKEGDSVHPSNTKENDTYLKFIDLLNKEGIDLKCKK